MGTPNWWHSHGRYPYLLAKGIGAALVAAVLVVLVFRLRLVVIPVLFAGAIAFVLCTRPRTGSSGGAFPAAWRRRPWSSSRCSPRRRWSC
ncbi:MAG: hypothetical protein FJ087_20545 [Deltaproteobacteria bacterium]|nr:hypothetical protein [Deltaproteobacteria bacterium]